MNDFKNTIDINKIDKYIEVFYKNGNSDFEKKIEDEYGKMSEEDKKNVDLYREIKKIISKDTCEIESEEYYLKLFYNGNPSDSLKEYVKYKVQNKTYMSNKYILKDKDIYLLDLNEKIEIIMNEEKKESYLKKILLDSLKNEIEILNNNNLSIEDLLSMKKEKTIREKYFQIFKEDSTNEVLNIMKNIMNNKDKKKTDDTEDDIKTFNNRISVINFESGDKEKEESLITFLKNIMKNESKGYTSTEIKKELFLKSDLYQKNPDLLLKLYINTNDLEVKELIKKITEILDQGENKGFDLKSIESITDVRKRLVNNMNSILPQLSSPERVKLILHFKNNFDEIIKEEVKNSTFKERKIEIKKDNKKKTELELEKINKQIDEIEFKIGMDEEVTDYQYEREGLVDVKRDLEKSIKSQDEEIIQIENSFNNKKRTELELEKINKQIDEIEFKIGMDEEVTDYQYEREELVNVKRDLEKSIKSQDEEIIQIENISFAAEYDQFEEEFKNSVFKKGDITDFKISNQEIEEIEDLKIKLKEGEEIMSLKDLDFRIDSINNIELKSTQEFNEDKNDRTYKNSNEKHNFAITIEEIEERLNRIEKNGESSEELDNLIRIISNSVICGPIIEGSSGVSRSLYGSKNNEKYYHNQIVSLFNEPLSLKDEFLKLVDDPNSLLVGTPTATKLTTLIDDRFNKLSFNSGLGDEKNNLIKLAVIESINKQVEDLQIEMFLSKEDNMKDIIDLLENKYEGKKSKELAYIEELCKNSIIGDSITKEKIMNKIIQRDRLSDKDLFEKILEDNAEKPIGLFKTLDNYKNSGKQSRSETKQIKRIKSQIETNLIYSGFDKNKIIVDNKILNSGKELYKRLVLDNYHLSPLLSQELNNILGSIEGGHLTITEIKNNYTWAKELKEKEIVSLIRRIKENNYIMNGVFLKDKSSYYHRKEVSEVIKEKVVKEEKEKEEKEEKNYNKIDFFSQKARFERKLEVESNKYKTNVKKGHNENIDQIKIQSHTPLSFLSSTIIGMSKGVYSGVKVEVTGEDSKNGDSVVVKSVKPMYEEVVMGIANQFPKKGSFTSIIEHMGINLNDIEDARKIVNENISKQEERYIDISKKYIETKKEEVRSKKDTPTIEKITINVDFDSIDTEIKSSKNIKIKKEEFEIFEPIKNKDVFFSNNNKTKDFLKEDKEERETTNKNFKRNVIMSKMYKIYSDEIKGPNAFNEDNKKGTLNRIILGLISIEELLDGEKNIFSDIEFKKLLIGMLGDKKDEVLDEDFVLYSNNDLKKTINGITGNILKQSGSAPTIIDLEDKLNIYLSNIYKESPNIHTFFKPKQNKVTEKSSILEKINILVKVEIEANKNNNKNIEGLSKLDPSKRIDTNYLYKIREQYELGCYNLSEKVDIKEEERINLEEEISTLFKEMKKDIYFIYKNEDKADQILKETCEKIFKSKEEGEYYKELNKNITEEIFKEVLLDLKRKSDNLKYADINQEELKREQERFTGFLSLEGQEYYEVKEVFGIKTLTEKGLLRLEDEIEIRTEDEPEEINHYFNKKAIDSINLKGDFPNLYIKYENKTNKETYEDNFKENYGLIINNINKKKVEVNSLEKQKNIKNKKTGRGLSF